MRKWFPVPFTTEKISARGSAYNFCSGDLYLGHISLQIHSNSFFSIIRSFDGLQSRYWQHNKINIFLYPIEDDNSYVSYGHFVMKLSRYIVDSKLYFMIEVHKENIGCGVLDLFKIDQVL
jgi:hypothetical protein